MNKRIKQAAKTLSVRPDAIVSAEEAPAGLVIETHEGVRYVDVPAGSPDAEGKTGLMFLVPPNPERTYAFPVYSPFPPAPEPSEEPPPGDAGSIDFDFDRDVESAKGGNYTLPNGDKIRGKKKAQAGLAKLQEETTARVDQLVASITKSFEPEGGADEATAVVSAGLAGDGVPLQPFGVAITDEAVQAQAVEDGLVSEGDPTGATAVLARLAVIEAQVATATGEGGGADE